MPTVLIMRARKPRLVTAAFVPAEPLALSRAVDQFVFATSWRNQQIEVHGDVNNIDHMVGRIESVTAVWLASGKIRELSQLSTLILARGRRLQHRIGRQNREHTSCELLALRVIWLMEFIERSAAKRWLQQQRDVLDDIAREFAPLPLP